MPSQPSAQPPRTTDVAQRELEALLSQFIPVIQAFANRLARCLPAALDADDLVSVGVIGLMDALAKYDPGRGVQFKTYAEFRIRGAMLDEIRSMNWVPRSIRECSATLQRVSQDLLQRLGHPPSDDDLAEALNLSPEEIRQLRANARAPSFVSLEDIEGEAFTAHRLHRLLADKRHPDPMSLTHTETLRRMLQDAITLLPERERRVLMLYYRDELTMKQISELLCVTESRICQIHRQAITRLRTQLI